MIFLHIALFLGGFVNYLILKDFKSESEKWHFTIWTIIIHSKILFTILVFSPFMKLFFEENTINIIKVIFVFVFIIAGTFSKTLREYSIKKSIIYKE